MNSTDSGTEDIEIQIMKKFESARRASYFIFENYYNSESVNKEDLRYSKLETWEYLKELYNLICVYFETKKLENYLTNFKSKFEPIICNQESAIKIDSMQFPDGDSTEDLKLIWEWDLILKPFSLFEKIPKKSKSNLLIVLKNTNDILKSFGIRPKREDDINKKMREVLCWFYPNVIAFTEGYFRHQFSQYKPDIIIKELQTCVEYKLIRDSKNIGLYLNQLVVDSKNYTDNIHNRHCIAVLCIEKSVIVSEIAIIDEWHRLKFPNNWELIIIKDVECLSLKNNLN